MEICRHQLIQHYSRIQTGEMVALKIHPWMQPTEPYQKQFTGTLHSLRLGNCFEIGMIDVW